MVQFVTAVVVVTVVVVRGSVLELMTGFSVAGRSLAFVPFNIIDVQTVATTEDEPREEEGEAIDRQRNEKRNST